MIDPSGRRPRPAQLSLDLPPRPALTRADFLVTDANAAAMERLDAWPDGSAAAMALVGPQGSGKTHLLQIWSADRGAPVVEGAALETMDVGLLSALLSERGLAAVDAADCVAGSPAAERSLFHLYNIARERGGGLLLAAREPPARWAVALPDLRTRLRAAAVVELGAPDETLIAAVLVKLFSDRQLRAPPEVVDYLLPRMERSLDAARRLAAEIDRRSLAARRAVTVPLAAEALGALSTAQGVLDLGSKQGE